jgi:hypothetical protein
MKSVRIAILSCNIQNHTTSVVQSRNGLIAGCKCLQSRPVCYVVCVLLSPASPFQPPSPICVTPCTTDTATTLYSLVGPPASVTSVLLGSPGMSPQPPPRSHSFCCSPQVSGTTDQSSDDEVRIPHLHGTFPPQPSAHAAPPSPADIADEVLIPRFWQRAALVLCGGDAEVSLPRPVFLAFLPPPPLLLFALNLPCRLAAVADALLVMVKSD